MLYKTNEEAYRYIQNGIWTSMHAVYNVFTCLSHDAKILSFSKI